MSSILVTDRPYRQQTVPYRQQTVPYRQQTVPERHLALVPAPRRQPALRLTRRGKVVLFLVALAALLILGVGFGAQTSATGHAGTQVATTTVTVKPGETLWQIAAKANPNGDPRSTVDAIMRLNSLPSASGLQMGAKIAVPVYHK